MRIHLDTDIGGDPDDLAALAMLLADPGVELAGITTSADAEGKRASFTQYTLSLAARRGIPVATGARGFLGGVPHFPGAQDDRYWPGITLDPPGAPGEALDLLASNIAAGCRVVVIGPFTNLALLETMRPGTLATADVVVMGGYTGLPAAGLPQWTPEIDYNVQSDQVAARIVYEAGNPLIVPLNVCFGVPLLAASLAKLDAGGPVARLVALQARLNGGSGYWARLAEKHPALPADTLNIQWDPVACAAALGWECCAIEEPAMRLVEEGGHLRFVHDPLGKTRRVMTSVESAAFTVRWESLVASI